MLRSGVVGLVIVTSCEGPGWGPSPAGSSTGSSDTSTGEVPVEPPPPIDMGVFDPWPNLPSPDCSTLVLPGNSLDVAASPRADADAELLALRVSGGAFVARQGDYEVVAADLVAIRELAPELAEIRIACEDPYYYSFFAFGAGGFELANAIFNATFHAWDCHNAFYGIEHRAYGSGGGDVDRVDGIGFEMDVAGLYDSDQFIASYQAIDGLTDVTISFVGPADDVSLDCDPDDGTIDLVAEAVPLIIGTRTYTFTDPILGARVFSVNSGTPPVER